MISPSWTVLMIQFDRYFYDVSFYKSLVHALNTCNELILFWGRKRHISSLCTPCEALGGAWPLGFWSNLCVKADFCLFREKRSKADKGDQAVCKLGSLSVGRKRPKAIFKLISKLMAMCYIFIRYIYCFFYDIRGQVIIKSNIYRFITAGFNYKPQFRNLLKWIKL